MKLTPWFPASTPPVRPGVYQRNIGLLSGKIVYSAWDGVRWMSNCGRPDNAAKSSYPSIYQSSPWWRGLTREVTR